ncbi:uncharacterized protein EV154DRAFT_589985 [Mucor mucedo]|uniref:uncharacterized protein n=1 Tax=Mucor mucedo TaxID=29922 RepID=UPI0022207E3C|nr:uncharacterized protein EV154DRAFT_589985 [Mucor mucedo]KAI7890566.1 hypothetical protein EV154DRAFT_589985 [Mucor mucedo]
MSVNNLDHVSIWCDKPDYAGLLKDGPTALAGNIKNDTFRTFSTDTKFTGNVREDLLIRMLNTFVRVNNESNSHATMVCNQLIFHWIESLTYFCGQNMSPNTYAFASVMTFSACIPPLSELLKLWKYMFAPGRHMNFLFIIAQLALICTELLQSPSPINLLPVLPPLRAKAIINLASSKSWNTKLVYSKYFGQTERGSEAYVKKMSLVIYSTNVFKNKCDTTVPF